MKEESSLSDNTGSETWCFTGATHTGVVSIVEKSAVKALIETQDSPLWWRGGPKLGTGEAWHRYGPGVYRGVTGQRGGLLRAPTLAVVFKLSPCDL